jgi:hypothetical protein
MKPMANHPKVPENRSNMGICHKWIIGPYYQLSCFPGKYQYPNENDIFQISEGCVNPGRNIISLPQNFLPKYAEKFLKATKHAYPPAKIPAQENTDNDNTASSTKLEVKVLEINPPPASNFIHCFKSPERT